MALYVDIKDAMGTKIARAVIQNTGAGDHETGSYRVDFNLWRDGRLEFRSVELEGFPRTQLGVWSLLQRALDAAFTLKTPDHPSPTST